MQRSPYRRHLPHIIPEGVPIFVTTNLKGAIPSHVAESLERQRTALDNESLRSGESADERRTRHNKILFGRADEYLDGTTDGPLHLKDPATAKIVEDSILFGAGERYELYAYVVMANHIHVLLKPKWRFDKIMQGLKGFTAYEINKLHDARCRTFWMDESYDHAVRDDDEFLRIIEYIESNPVKAGLCLRREDWLWSSGSKRRNWPVGQAFEPETDGERIRDL